MDIVDDLAFTQNIYTSEEEVLSVLKEVIQKLIEHHDALRSIFPTHDRLMKQISSFMNEIADEFKIVVVTAIRNPWWSERFVFATRIF